MEHDTNAYLYDIIQSYQNIRTFTANIDLQTYEAICSLNQQSKDSSLSSAEP